MRTFPARVVLAAALLVGFTASPAAARSLAGSNSGTQPSINCAPTYDSGYGAHFDLTPLIRASSEPSYGVTDGDIACTTNTQEKNYTYVFNVCRDVTEQSLPKYCVDAKVGGPAVQVDPDPFAVDKTCHVLGSREEYRLIDESDPSKGIELLYLDGDKCNHPTAHGPSARQIALKFTCANNPVPVPQVANEPEHCSYVVEMPTMYGCPLECPIAGRQLCGGHGICGYDKTNHVAKCFCDSGFSGNDCTEPSDAPSGSTGAIIALLVTVLIIALGLLGALFVTVRMLKSYRDDARNYLAMHDTSISDSADI